MFVCVCAHIKHEGKYYFVFYCIKGYFYVLMRLLNENMVRITLSCKDSASC